MHALRYGIIVQPDCDGGSFVALVTELPGCRSDGETPYDVIACWIEAARDLGRSIPEPRRAAA